MIYATLIPIRCESKALQRSHRFYRELKLTLTRAAPAPHRYHHFFFSLHTAAPHLWKHHSKLTTTFASASG